jgi:HNH endonuclease
MRMSQRPQVEYWWVNLGRLEARAIGDSLWSPHRNRKGAKHESFKNLTRVQPGDLVFVFADAALRAIGIALRNAFEAPPPPGLSAGRTAADVGWQLPIRFFELAVPLVPKSHMGALRSVLPRHQSPLRATGVREPNVYLTAVPANMAAVLRRLLAGQVEDVEAQIKAAVVSELADDWVESAVRHRTDIDPVDKQQLIRARRGLGLFRSRLEQFESCCRVTGLLDRRHLRACHIKPWSVSEDAEKIDGCNGLLLSPHIAHLFARGYISFGDDGELLASGHLNPAVVQSWGLTLPANVGTFLPRQCEYLDYHRREIFERTEAGRRSP